MDELELDLNNYDEMGTSINDIKECKYNNKKDNKYNNDTDNKYNNLKDNRKDININNFVRELETKLDNYDTHINILPSNTDVSNYKKQNYIETLVDIEDIKPEIRSKKNHDTYRIYNFLIFIKEPLLLVLLFILLNNNDLIKMVSKVSLFNNHYGSLIIRGILLAILFYYLRKLN